VRLFESTTVPYTVQYKSHTAMDVRGMGLHLQDRVLSRAGQYWVAVAGPPGSGKSSVAHAVADHCRKEGIRAYRSMPLFSNRELPSLCDCPGTCVIGMDGFHYYKSELDTMEHPAEAHRRRGAPFT
jgi:pantothenate kinase